MAFTDHISKLIPAMIIGILRVWPAVMPCHVQSGERQKSSVRERKVPYQMRKREDLMPVFLSHADPLSADEIGTAPP